MITLKGIDQSFSIREREKAISELRPSPDKPYVYIQTCNRVELYEGDGTAGFETALHIFKVVSGLKSSMLGENHIQGQVKRAYMAAIEENHISPGLHHLFQAALRTGKRVRTETSIARGSVSHSQAAFTLLQKSICALYSKKILLIGINHLTTNIVYLLKNIGNEELYLCNRTDSTAFSQAEKLFCKTVPYENFRKKLDQIDVIITATASSKPLLLAKEFPVSKEVVCVDLSVPRNIEECAGDLSHVQLYNLDDVERCVEFNLNMRKKALEKAEAIIMEEAKSYWAQKENRIYA
ncbi:Glutamyl-tRNA reductase [Chitinispirillum alkaliphilum]|nr:Glutamyl-tRNA reductase [Chitinispirillum alkaliphilum]